MTQFHAVGGRYDVGGKWIGLDYVTSFMQEPPHVEAIVAHEYAHAVIANDDFGQVTNLFYLQQNEFAHISKSEGAKMGALLFRSQDLVQEGLATLYQVIRLASFIGKPNALRWADDNLPPYYKTKFDSLKFATAFSPRYRDFFMNKSHVLAMTNGLRQDCAPRNLFESYESLNNYLTVAHLPNARFVAVFDAIRVNPWLATKPLEEIAKAAGIKYFEPASKQESADLLTYATSFTSKPQQYTERDIGDPPSSGEMGEQAMSSILVGNLNLNLAESAELVLNIGDFLHYADVLDLVSVNYRGKNWEHSESIKKQTGITPEIALIGIANTGAKYLAYCDTRTAEEVLGVTLARTTSIVKWGGYSILEDKYIWTQKELRPHIVWYNTPEDLEKYLKEAIGANNKVRFKRLHAGATVNHPIQTLFVLVEGSPTLHITTTFGNVKIGRVIELIRDKSKVMEHADIQSFGGHWNNFMILQGFPRQVDWAGTMIAQDRLVMREG